MREQLHILGLIQPRSLPQTPYWDRDNLEERKGIPSGLPQEEEEEDLEGLQEQDQIQ